MRITNKQVQRFDEDGVVTIDTPLTQAQLSAAVDVLDDKLPFRDPEGDAQPRYRYGLSTYSEELAFVEIVQHPFFEEVACKALRADEVTFNGVSATKTFPNPNAEFSFGQHVDIQYCTSDLDATPRRMICSFFLWLDAVNERRAPLVARPGSHRLLADFRESDPALKAAPIEVKGVTLDNLPELGYADPEPISAEAGQVSVLTTALVHGPSTNIGTEPRYSAHITFVPKGFEFIQTPQNVESQQRHSAELRKRVSPGRRHIFKDC